MQKIQGEGVSKGKASGRLSFIECNTYIVDQKERCACVETELEKFQKARADAMNQLQSSYERALGKVGEADAKIFVIQQMMIHENGFTGAVKKLIAEEKVTAQYAVYAIAMRHMEMLEATNDEYIMARTADIRDVSQRIIRNMNPKNRNVFTPPVGKNIIIYKRYLTPSEIIELDPRYISAAITYKDSKFSHSAILARTMNLPRVTGIPEDIHRYHGRSVTVDADTGEISIDA